MATHLERVLMFTGSIWRVSEKVRLSNKVLWKLMLNVLFCGQLSFSLSPPGARWDVSAGVLSEAVLKDLTPAMPVLYIRAVPADKLELNNTYECPVYRTKLRGPTFIWSFHLKTRHPPAKWVQAGVALLLSV